MDRAPQFPIPGRAGAAPVPAPLAGRFAGPLWTIGFRPFYLCAGGFAALSIALWVMQVEGWLGQPCLAGPLWHAHEMLFGFTMAVLAGFLLTAVREWTGRPTVSGPGLALLVGLWMAGRIAMATPFAFAAGILNVAFPLALAVAIAVPLRASRNRRNFFFPGLLVGCAAACAAFHVAQSGRWQVSPWLGITGALDVILFIVTVMAGRVVPMFTNNAIAGAGARRQPLVERVVLGATLALLPLDVLSAPPAWIAVAAGVAALAHMVRFALWHPWRTWRLPLVWVLHVAYAWIPAHLALRVLAGAGGAPSALATHALTVGAIGGMTLAMMTRSARGHTGRPLVADHADVACYALVFLAAALRVGGPMLLPWAYAATVLCAGVSWTAAFGLFTARYWPRLTQAAGGQS